MRTKEEESKSEKVRRKGLHHLQTRRAGCQQCILSRGGHQSALTTSPVLSWLSMPQGPPSCAHHVWTQRQTMHASEVTIQLPKWWKPFHMQELLYHIYTKMVACTNSQLLQDELLSSSRAMNNTKLTAWGKKERKNKAATVNIHSAANPLPIIIPEIGYI